jgi:glycosyltransferase involved in cell wall biosynthesis
MLSYTSAVTIALDATPLIVTGGVQRYTLELASALAAEFPDDQYWLLSDQMIAKPLVVTGNLHYGDQPNTWAGRKWWTWGLEREMSRRGVELFHGTDFAVPYLRRRASVLTLHDLSPWMEGGSGRVRRRTPLLLRLGLATMVITPSEAVRRGVLERFRLSPDRVVAVPLAAGEFFRPVEVAPTRRYFLFLGTLEARKNVGRLIEAWREVRKRHDVDLVLAGRARPDFPLPAPEPGLRVLGAVPEKDLPSLYSGALACVYPSLYEGFGLPVLEAMQCGCLVITSRDPAIQEVTNGAAVHVDAEDTKSLAEAVAAVASAPETFSGLRQQALRRSGDFTWQRTARQTREVYDSARRIFR